MCMATTSQGQMCSSSSKAGLFVKGIRDTYKYGKVTPSNKSRVWDYVEVCNCHLNCAFNKTGVQIGGRKQRYINAESMEEVLWLRTIRKKAARKKRRIEREKKRAAVKPAKKTGKIPKKKNHVSSNNWRAALGQPTKY